MNFCQKWYFGIGWGVGVGGLCCCIVCFLWFVFHLKEKFKLSFLACGHTYTRHMHEHKVNMYRLYNGVKVENK